MVAGCSWLQMQRARPSLPGHSLPEPFLGGQPWPSRWTCDPSSHVRVSVAGAAVGP